MALKHEYSLGNITAFIITGMIIVTVAVVMRLWARKMAKIPWRSDDYTLIVALVGRREEFYAAERARMVGTKDTADLGNLQ